MAPLRRLALAGGLVQEQPRMREFCSLAAFLDEPFGVGAGLSDVGVGRESFDESLPQIPTPA
jgi:hypothetical protein